MTTITSEMAHTVHRLHHTQLVIWQKVMFTRIILVDTLVFDYNYTYWCVVSKIILVNILNSRNRSSIIFARWQHLSWSCSWAVHLQPPFRGKGRLYGIIDHTIGNEQWWFPIDSPLWPMHYISPFSRNLPSNVSPAETNRVLDHFGAKFWDEGVDRCKPNFNTIWERHGADVCKRNCVDVFCHLSTMNKHYTQRQTDRQTDRQTMEW